MGVVYEAHDPNIDRQVALKTIRIDDLGEDLAAEYEVRFKVEAQAAGRLHHPHIVSVYDAGRDAGMAYMVMELVQGTDLKRSLSSGTRYTLERSLRLMADLLNALDFAHGQSVIHRDVKPANVMLDRGGRVKLADFGLARLADLGDATRAGGSVLGTPKYMSPEQVRGEKVDSRTDLYSASVLFYRLITGVVPFDGDRDFAVLRKICNEPHRPPTALNPGVPPAIDGLMDKLLAKARDDRFATAQQFAFSLRAFAKEADISMLQSVPAQAVRSNDKVHDAGLRGLEATSRGSTTGVSVPPSSTLAQELELTYWKDIQGSAGASDFEAFLQQFPEGVYAGLARRRLRKIKSLSGSTTRIDLPTEARSWPQPNPHGSMATRVVDDDATQLFRPGERASIWPPVEVRSTPEAAGKLPISVADVQAPALSLTPNPAAPVEPVPEPEPSLTNTRPNAPVMPGPRAALFNGRHGSWWSGGVVTAVVLAGVLIWHSRSKPMQAIGAAPASVVASAPAAEPAVPATRAQLPASPAPTEQGAMSGAEDAASAATFNAAVASGTPPAPVAASASANLLSPATKPKAKPRPSPSEPSPESKPRPSPSEALPDSKPMVVSSPEVSLPSPPAVPEPPSIPAGPSSPSEACANRNFLVRPMCEYRQCARPEFREHAECVEMRAREHERDSSR